MERSLDNPFEAHGIPHLSPSSCNLFTSSPAMFVMQKCLKKKGAVGPAAYRGSAVEDGVAYGLLNPEANFADCTKVALEKFNTLAGFISGDKVEKERNAIPNMVEQGLMELKPYGIPSSTQGLISLDFDDLLVPMIGYYDFEWEQHGVLTDLKTTHALPSKISQPHARQVALYRAARGDNMQARVTYITPKKRATYALENAREHVDALGQIGRAIQRFLAVSKDPMELAMLVIPDTGSFYFNDPVTRQMAFEIWNV
tara:strand:- start:1631 stop:2398 length:768 start_codon:yes stop_codon:yes gene_type:complete